MSDRKAELNAKLEILRKQTREMAQHVPQRVTAKLLYNAELQPSIFDFDSGFEQKCKLDVDLISMYPGRDEQIDDLGTVLERANKLIENMRQVRRDLYNLEFAERQHAGPDNTMTTTDPDEGF